MYKYTIRIYPRDRHVEKLKAEDYIFCETDTSVKKRCVQSEKKKRDLSCAQERYEHQKRLVPFQ